MKTLLLFVISLMTYHGFNVSKDSELSYIEHNDDDYFDEDIYSLKAPGQEYLSLNNKEIPYAEENLNFLLKADTPNRIIDTEVIENDLSFKSNITFDKDYTSKVELRLDDERGYNVVKAKLDSGGSISLSIYAIRTELGVFISTDSYETTNDYYYSYRYNNEMMSEEEYEEYLNEKNKEVAQSEYKSYPTSSKRLKAASGDYMEFKGTLKWTNSITSSSIEDINNQNKSLLPLRYIKVQAVVYIIQIGASGTIPPVTQAEYTDYYGYYSFKIDIAVSLISKVVIKITAETENAHVKTGTLGNIYTYSKTYSSSQLKSNNIYQEDVTFNMSNNTGKAMQIAQAIAYGNEYVRSVNEGIVAPSVDVHFPQNYSRYNTPIGDYRWIDLTSEAYRFWDVILHEYGHHLQNYVIDISKMVGGIHWTNASTLINCNKKDAIALAWGEAWPSVYAVQVTQYFKNDLLYNNKLRIDYICDTKWDSYDSYSDENIFCIYMEKNYYYHFIGETSECSIINVLYDIYDLDEIGEDYNDNDGVSLGHKGFWDLLKNSKAKSFSEFAYYIYENNCIDIGVFNKLIYKSGFSINIAETWFINNSFNINWSLNQHRFSNISSEEQEKYNKYLYLNKFRIEFYDKYNHLIFSTPEINKTYTLDSDMNVSYTLTTSEWSKILLAPGDNFSFTIASYQSAEPITGPYYSELITITKPTVQGDTYLLTSKDYGFSGAYNDTSTNGVINISDLSIVPARKRCALIENEYIVLSPRKSGYGEAFVSYIFSKPVYEIEFTMSLWSDKEYLKPEESEIIISILDEEGKEVVVKEVDIKTLSTNIYAPTSIKLEFSERIVDHLAIIVRTADIGNHNKGRVVIGNMLIRTREDVV